MEKAALPGGLLPCGPAARLPVFARWRGRVGTESFPKRHLWAAYGGPCRMRGRSAPRAPRVTLSMEKESPESQPRGHPPWQSPWGTQVRLEKRSRSARPCPTGTKPHQARECPSRRQPPKIVTDRGPSLTTHKRSRGIPGFSIPPAGSLASRYHPYSSEYGAGTCPRVAETQPFFVFPRVSGGWWKTTRHRTFPSRADRGGTPVIYVRAA